jgi:hypothetical protein
MHEKLYSYSWEEYKKAVDLYNETGSMHTSEGSAWDGSNLSGTFMSMDGTTSMDGTDLDNTMSTADTTMKSNI